MSKPHARNFDSSLVGVTNSRKRIVIAAVLLVAGIAWLIVFTKVAAPHAFWEQGLGAEPTNPIPWMAKMKMWNYLIAFGMILASLWIAADKSTPLGRGRGVVIGMVGCLLIGLIWIVLFYLMGNTGKIPVMNHLGQWNLALGMAIIATSFAFATKWE